MIGDLWSRALEGYPVEKLPAGWTCNTVGALAFWMEAQNCQRDIICLAIGYSFPLLEHGSFNGRPD
jgi:hypothetical protein